MKITHVMAIAGTLLANSGLSAQEVKEISPIVARKLLLCDSVEQIVEILDGVTRKVNIQESIGEINKREETTACGLAENIRVIGAENQGDYETGGKERSIWKVKVLAPNGRQVDQYTWGEEQLEKI